LVAVLVAAVVGLLLILRSDDPPASDDEPLPPVAVTSDAPRLGTLSELVDASDIVVRARVTGTERGRVFGEGDAAIESRIVRLRVTKVLRGPAVAVDDTLLVEEEGWTADGAPLVVDGLAPSEPGDDAVWFLVRVGQDEEARHVAVSAEGRYLVRGDRLEGAAGDDPLVAELSALGTTGLETAVAASP
jgi:hypothetical protein